MALTETNEYDKIEIVGDYKHVQIRKAIYTDSIKKYMPYKKLLKKYGSKYRWFN